MQRILLFTVALLNVLVNAHTQSWTVIDTSQIINKGDRYLEPKAFLTFKLDNQAMKNALWKSPHEKAGIDVYASPNIISVPLPDGSIDQFRMVEYNIGEQELLDKFPDIKTFYGVSVNNPYRSIMVDYTHFGFKAMISTFDESTVFVDNFQFNDNDTKIIYYKKDNLRKERWFCGVKDEDFTHAETSSRSLMIGDCQLREYRLALSANGEYVDFFIPGPSPPTAADSTAANIALVHSAVTTSMNRVNGVFMKEFAIRMILVANNNILYYFNPNTDGYTNSNPNNEMLTENQAKTTARIGSANYDIGHVFSTGGGGVAALQSPCNNSIKAQGVTGSTAPVGDPYDIDYVAHEMGHQFGGNHTQNNNCQRSAAACREPGSASSIMGYAGICSPNVQNNSHDNFHAYNIQEIKNFALAGGSCGVVNGTFVNSPPSITPQSSYRIPKSTPFAMTLSATDPNGHAMTYAWDQMDNQVVTQPPASTNTGGPTFRAISPSTSPTRYFPNLTAILAGATVGAPFGGNNWEVLPSVARTINFRGVVRDFTGLAGCNSEIDVPVVVDGIAGPFSITSTNTATTYPQGSSQTVTWNVSGTNANGINCNQVDLMWTTNSGTSFSTLVAGVANDGSQTIVIPSANTTTGRIMVKAVGNIFLDINNANITVNAGTATYNLSFDSYYRTLCQGQSHVFTVTVSSFGGYTTPVNLSVSGLPAGMTASFSNASVTPGSTTMLTITNATATAGTYALSLNGVSGAINKSMDFSVVSFVSVGALTLSTPANNATAVSLKPIFTWSAATNATTYELQLSRKSDFSNILLNVQNLTNTTYTATTFLVGYSEYFWRVRAVNSCGAGVWQSFKFDTESCIMQTSSNVPIAIPVSGTITSNLPITDKGTVNDLDVVDLEGTHSWVGDLRVTVISPANTNVRVWEQPCNDNDNFDINFNQSATLAIPCPPVDGLDHPPTGAGVGTLNSFNTQNVRGNWRLQIQDLATPDGGSLNTWRLKTCVTNFCRLTVDTDAEKGAGSLLAAINCAANGDTIRFASTFMNDTITLFTSNIVTNKRLFIDADPAKNIHIMSTGTNPTIVSSTPNTLEGLKIRGLHIHGANNAVGAILNTGLLNLVDVTLYKGIGSSTAVIQNNSGGINNVSGNCKVIPN